MKQKMKDSYSRKVFILGIFCLFFNLNFLTAEGQLSAQSAAEFTFNILSFIDWSGVATPQLTVNIFADDIQYKQAFSDFIGHKTIQRKTIKLVPINDITAANGQVIIVCNSGISQIPKIKNRKILIIGLGADAIANGADIAIYNDSGPKYKINEASLAAKNIKYNNDLIHYATQ